VWNVDFDRCNIGTFELSNGNTEMRKKEHRISRRCGNWDLSKMAKSTKYIILTFSNDGIWVSSSLDAKC
jgi:hypothetical protein